MIPSTSTSQPKRPITYQIAKNKSSLPRTSKGKAPKNPRVKRRVKYEKAVKKLHSFQRAGKVQDGNYAGEVNGIRDDVSHSIKF